jgi:2,4-dienoyl-CoA reductase-like NADH-dependent reductase (Old Yellow Enzyme family)
VGITTLAYCAVSPNGRTFEDQMYMHEELLPALRQITDAVHAEGGAIAAQMGHCGYFSKNTELTIPRPLGPSGRFNELGAMRGIPFSGGMTKADIGQTVREYGAAADLLKRAGFDAIEMHMGHGYLLSQFLSPLANKRKDEYGGSLHNRLRMPVAAFHAVREAVGEDFPIWAKINLSDGVKGGLEVEDAALVAQRLESEGIDALQMSGGFTSLSPMYLLRGARPLNDMVAVEKNDFQKVALRLFGSTIIKEYPFEEMFFLEQAKVIRDAVELPLIYLGGVSSAENMRRAMAEGFDFVAMARALIRDPEMLLKIAKGECDYQTECDRCNKCIAAMDSPSGTRCVRDETDFYND